ncbi:hypothetical protein NC981_03385 [Leptolyngbya sp. DQ-M1]|uniref:hypothetical protein n=1 Tax=Leptolyngbya sp. DQ-M1 TaxID=2933920 RepID=UPI003298D079
MSRSAFSSTIETVLSQTVVARLLLEECECLIGSGYGVVLQAISVETRTFELMPMPALVLPLVESVDEAAISQALIALKAQRSIEICGRGFGKVALLRSLAHQPELQQAYPHGILYLDQLDPIGDLLQTIFEQFYRVPSEVKPSRAEIRSGLSDRQALILLDHSKLTATDFEQLQRWLPQSRFAIASTDRRLAQADLAIQVPEPVEIDLSERSDAEIAVLELLATVGVPLSAKQITAIANVSHPNLDRLIDLKLIGVERGRYRLRIQHRSSEAWMERVLSYVLDWIRTQPNAILQERELLMLAVQWGANQRRSVEVIEMVRSIESEFAIAKLWDSWSKLLRCSLAAAWALGDAAIEAWALHQLGTLAFCQQEVTSGYDALRDALAIRTDLAEQSTNSECAVSIAFSAHNLNQIKALIVPVKSNASQRSSQRYWIIGVTCAIALSLSLGVKLVADQRSPNHKPCSSPSQKVCLLLTRFS